ncbi:hypothetical protein PDE_09806 [Penicillium oxalicum 114-2]|uniref:Uncharacterized protein n=1 Tax=Penicillium oxalicum (strain 114-2 / CGMCC 5302) TaxID=933388 RepID=S8BHZ1_PENO1|nr:hypothetical protein PDE_09806 [Penicillium oxalicum 114-2]
MTPIFSCSFSVPLRISEIAFAALAYIHHLVELLVSFAWVAAFGLLVAAIRDHGCIGIQSWLSQEDSDCELWKAIEAFCFLSAIAWFITALVPFAPQLEFDRLIGLCSNIHAASAHVHQETTKQEFGSPEAGRDFRRTQFAKMALS